MKNTILKIIVVFLWIISSNVYAGKVAIVIDDIGYKVTDQRLLSLDAPLTYAILPHTPFGFKYANEAYIKNRDVLVHLPMQATSNNRLLGPGALTSAMAKREYQQTLLKALEDIPYAVGINNHMGSLLTTLDQPMSWTMEILHQHNMFFLDSKTTKRSKVSPIAKRYGVESLGRNIFLDHYREQRAIALQFNRLIRIAKAKGKAIAIGHPYKETYQFLKDNLHKLEQAGVQLVPLTDLLYSPQFASVDRSDEDQGE